MGVKSLPKTVSRQCRDCDLNPGPFCAWVQHANHSATEPPRSTAYWVGILWVSLKKSEKAELRQTINTAFKRRDLLTVATNSSNVLKFSQSLRLCATVPLFKYMFSICVRKINSICAAQENAANLSLVSLGLCENAKVRLSDFGMIRATVCWKIAKRARPMNIWHASLHCEIDIWLASRVRKGISENLDP